MKVEIASFSATAEVHACSNQLIKAFAPVVAALAASRPDFSLIGSLILNIAFMHPLGSHSGKGSSRSYAKKEGIYFAATNIDYATLVSGSWRDRVNGVAEAAAKAAQLVAKTRITDAERATVLEIIDAARARVAADVPEALAPLNSVYVRDSGEGTPPQISYAPPLGGVAGMEEIKPEDAISAAAKWRAPEKAANAPASAFKLYRKTDGVLHYWEAWSHANAMSEHKGVCGKRGDLVEHPFARDSETRQIMADIKRHARAEGYAPIAPSRHAQLVVEYSLGDGDPGAALKRRHAVEEFLNEQTGWLGLGHCDGGSIGNGTMEVFCPVVDFDIAKTALTAVLAASPHRDFHRIYRMR